MLLPRAAILLVPLLICLPCLARARIVGCANLGAVSTDDADFVDDHGNMRSRISIEDTVFSEEDCALYKNIMSRPFLPRDGETRHPALVRHQNSTNVEGDAACSGRGWLISGREPTCHCFYEAAGDDCSQASPRDGLPVRGAVVYLMYGDTRYHENLVRALNHLSTAFLEQFPYPVIVFHSSNFAERMRPGDPTYLEELQRVCIVPLKFAAIELEFRDSLKERFAKDPPTGGACDGHSMNYKHMGRFFQYYMLRHPVLRDFDYVWRLDGDLDLVLGVPCDIFDIMRRSHAVFGYYYYTDWEDSRCGVVEGREAAFRYAEDRGFVPNHLGIMPVPSAYIGIWNVFDVRFWTSEKCLDFSDYMDATGLAYTTRMGEQIFYALTTSLLVSPAALHQYAGVGPFYHRGNEIIMGKREINGVNLIRDDVFCPEASEWDCDDFFECKEREGWPQAAGASLQGGKGGETPWEEL